MSVESVGWVCRLGRLNMGRFVDRSGRRRCHSDRFFLKLRINVAVAVAV